MPSTTSAEQLVEVRRRIERLRARALADDGVGALPRVRRRLDALQRAEASVHAASGDTAADLDERLAQLRARLDVAERSLEADAAVEPASFAAAVQAELRTWDTYLERLQTDAAGRAWQARARAEAAIGDVRSRRLEVDERLAQARAAARAGWPAERRRVTAARDALEQKADELSTALRR